MGDTKDSQSKILERLDEIEKRQILGSLDTIFLLLMPITLFIIGLTISFYTDLFASRILMSLLIVFILPTWIYLTGIWNSSVAHRLDAWIFFLIYLFFFLFAACPIYVLIELSPNKIAAGIASIFIGIGGFFASFNVFLKFFATKILSRFEKLEPKLGRIALVYKAVHIYSRKFLSISLVAWILAAIIYWRLTYVI